MKGDSCTHSGPLDHHAAELPTALLRGRHERKESVTPTLRDSRLRRQYLADGRALGSAADPARSGWRVQRRIDASAARTALRAVGRGGAPSTSSAYFAPSNVGDEIAADEGQISPSSRAVPVRFLTVHNVEVPLDPEPEGLQFKRNQLPQWRLQAGIYHVTTHLEDGVKPLKPAERTIIATAIKFFKDQRYRLSIFVVMDTHFHVLCQTLPRFPLDKTLLSWKSFPAHEINKVRGRSGSVFQKSNHTRLLSTQRHIDDVRQYIYNNPFERWKFPPHEYEWLEVFE